MPNKDIEHNNDNKSDLTSDQKSKIGAAIAILLGVFVIMSLILFLSNSNGGDGKDSDKVESDEHSKPVVDKKQFTFKVDKEERIEELKQEPTPTPPQVQIKEQVEFKPKLLKGIGVIPDATSLTQKQKEQSQAAIGKEYEQMKTALIESGGTATTTPGESEFVGETFSPTAAKASQFDSNFLLPKGSYIECSLNTRLVSQVKGGIACTIGNDVYSANGKVLLIEKGSKMTGMFKTGELNDGMNRLFVVWQEIRTPNNLVIPVYSGASDQLGGSGIDGEVDHHWMMRFGSAILLSAIDDVFNVLSSQIKSSNGNNNVNVDYTENSRETSQNIAAIALEKMINIKPTLYKTHGDIVGVYVNRDIDFSKVYSLSLSRKR